MAISRLAKRGRASNEKPDKLFDNWFATLIFCSITFIPTYILYFHKHSPEGALIFGCFALLALAQLLYAIRESMDLYKYGEVRYAESMTPTLGGELTGEVLLTRVTTGSGSKILHAELQCFQITFSANSKGRTTRHRKRVWYGEGKFRVRRLARVASAEIRIPIPYREGTESGISHEWELQVQMNVVGIDLIRTFPIEVRKGAAPVARPADRPALAEPAVSGITAASRVGSGQGHKPEVKIPAQIIPEVPVSAQPLVTPSVAALVVANLVPLAGVIFLDWNIKDIVMLYWIENLIIGLMNILRIYTASPEKLLKPKEKGTGVRPHELFQAKLVLIGFFVIHYGGFCFGHGMALAGLFVSMDHSHSQMEIGEIVVQMLTDPVYLLSIITLFCGHLYSFYKNYLGNGEYRRVDIGMLMVRPYGRIFVTHIFIIIGGLVIMLFANSISAVVTFIVIKILIDRHMHQREREIMAFSGEAG